MPSIPCTALPPHAPNCRARPCSHLQGLFYRTSRMIQAGIKPVYVFDGKPPQLKRDELARRGVRRDDAGDELKKAQEAGDQEAIERYSKRTIKVTQVHADECKKLLRLMGVPYVEVRWMRGVWWLAVAAATALDRWQGQALVHVE